MRPFAPEHLMAARRRLWTRLMELANISIMTEPEKMEERALSQEFWDWQEVEYRLRPDVLWVPWGEEDTHSLQRRILWAAHTNHSIGPDDIERLPMLAQNET